MQTISALLFGLCFAAALGGIVRLLSPDGSTKRLVRLCTALFVLTTALRPAQQLLRTLPEADVRENAEAAADAVRENARQAILGVTRRILDAHGFGQAQIQVDTLVRDGEVHAGAFIVSGVPAEQAQEIADEIFALTGERPVMETASRETAGG
jgi:predicted esterase